MHRLARLAWRAVTLVFVVGACARGPSPVVVTPPPGGVVVAFGSYVVRAEVALTPEQQQRGLMGRRRLGTDAGMLFLFGARQPQTSGFYMYRTIIPLSVAFLRKEGAGWRVVDVLDMTPCPASSPRGCPIYYPRSSYDAALETNRGWFRRHHVRVGSVARIGSRARVG